ncbi:hypothetical protein BKA01_001811 [Pseudonocardia eucalypti]|uniref:sucrase ferredoxin n=1 Tax=Pseudonocardia eucalypti TaxID=648755 RepID=UPI00161FEF59|nr:hypothetical protein [Pseudonocardia eucalypti]
MSTTKLPHCAALARQLGELPIGTASRIGSVLLIEHAGTWPVDVRERVLTECFGPGAPERMDRLHVGLGLRALIIRKPGRNRAPDRPTVYVGGCRPGQRWLERFQIDSYRDLADLDPVRIATGTGGFGEPVTGPLLLVCTHGRKDACCAMLGRPVADTLGALYPEQTWQCTHFGGDRWAGNLLVAPHGFMYGQLTPATALPVAELAGAGRISLANLRGRVGTDPFAQVAEIAVRERTGLTGLDEVLALGPREIGEDRAEVEVNTVLGGAYRVLVRRFPLGVQGHSVCSGEARPHRFEVLDVQTALPV